MLKLKKRLEFGALIDDCNAKSTTVFIKFIFVSRYLFYRSAFQNEIITEYARLTVNLVPARKTRRADIAASRLFASLNL